MTEDTPTYAIGSTAFVNFQDTVIGAMNNLETALTNIRSHRNGYSDLTECRLELAIKALELTLQENIIGESHD